jgi:hypothetical protein
MKFFRKNILSLAAPICLGAALAVFPQNPVRAQTLPPDVGLVTRLSGDPTYWNETYQKTPEKVQVFMKVRKGDHFKLSGGSLAQLIYFQNGRKETWKGPAAFVVGHTQSQAEGNKGIRAQPEVTTLPTEASQGIRRIPVLLRQARLGRLGAMQVRGGGESPRKTFVPSKKERAEITMAKENYQRLRKQTPPDDITPELNLFGILADYEQFEEMEKVVKDALKIQPDNEVLKELEEWVRTQRSKTTTK